MDISIFFKKTNDSINVILDYDDHIEIRIPINNIIWTKGYEIYQNTLKIRSLCRLHLNNKCKYREICMQIHITYDCIKKLKYIMNNKDIYNNCCEFHGDLYTICNNKIMDNIIINGLNITIQNKYIAKTSYFENINLKNNIISVNDICRAHQQHKCNYFFNCKYVHICRQYYDDIIKKQIEKYDINLDLVKNICFIECNKMNNEMYKEYINIYKLEEYKKIFGLKYIYGILKKELKYDDIFEKFKYDDDNDVLKKELKYEDDALESKYKDDILKKELKYDDALELKYKGDILKKELKYDNVLELKYKGDILKNKHLFFDSNNILFFEKFNIT